MRNPFKRKPPAPRFINGHLVRETGKSCPLCLVPANQWCLPGCEALDVMDYR